MYSVIAVAISLFVTGCQQNANSIKPIDKSDINQTIAYSIGADIGSNIANQDPDLDTNAFLAGFQDGYNNNPPQLTQEETMEALTEFRKRMMAKQQGAMGGNAGNPEAASKNKMLGQKFLEANAKQEGVVILPSGLQYKIEREGQGTPPGPEDTVRVHYRGTLVSGDQFDSSYDRGEPAEFPVGGVIPGWTEALQLMKPGAKWRLYIPPDLAYGDRGAGPKIQPGSTLQFEVELLEVVDQ